MSIWGAIILGLIQGIAEFFPVSSSGHLSIINNFFHLSTQDHLFFDVLLHLGTLGAILIVYWPELRQMYYEVVSFAGFGPLAGQPRERYPAARSFMMIVVASLPLLFVIPVRKLMEGLFYQNVLVGIMMILTGCLLYVSDKMKPGKKAGGSMTVLDAIIIGLCQCVATIPGLSRSGITITAGIATGLRRDFALKFSFLLSIPAVLGANIFGLVDAIMKGGLVWANVPAYLIGMLVAMIVGVFAIQILRYINSKGRFGGFAYYCWVIGVITIVLSLIF